MEDDIYREMKDLTRQRLRLIWEMAQMGVVPNDEDAVLAQALREHPEYYEIWDQVDELSDEELIQDGLNFVLCFAPLDFLSSYLLFLAMRAKTFSSSLLSPRSSRNPPSRKERLEIGDWRSGDSFSCNTSYSPWASLASSCTRCSGRSSPLKSTYSFSLAYTDGSA